MEEHFTTESWLEEANAGISGFISLLANCLLIYLTAKVKSYSDTVKRTQYYACCFRLAFSLLVVVIAPTVMYLDETKALYIAKGGSGFRIPDAGFLGPDSGFLGPDSGFLGPDSGFLGPHSGFLGPDSGFLGPDSGFLGPDSGFLGPDSGFRFPGPVQKTHSVLRTMITLIPLFVAIPTVILVLNGYVPNEYEKEISMEMILVVTGKNDTSFLMAAEEKIYDFSSGTFEYDVPARICTGFIFSAMLLSLIVVIVCFIKMQITMKKKTSISNQKSQKQLNLLLFVQFIFPFITIHIPFYVAFILPLLTLNSVPYLQNYRICLLGVQRSTQYW
ncbi:unnamed protein product [Caenorhabditis nigoni]